jgi:hypothetical protein
LPASGGLFHYEQIGTEREMNGVPKIARQGQFTSSQLSKFEGLRKNDGMT